MPRQFPPVVDGRKRGCCPNRLIVGGACPATPLLSNLETGPHRLKILDLCTASIRHPCPPPRAPRTLPDLAPPSLRTLPTPAGRVPPAIPAPMTPQDTSHGGRRTALETPTRGALDTTILQLPHLLHSTIAVTGDTTGTNIEPLLSPTGLATGNLPRPQRNHLYTAFLGRLPCPHLRHFRRTILRLTGTIDCIPHCLLLHHLLLHCSPRRHLLRAGSHRLHLPRFRLVPLPLPQRVPAPRSRMESLRACLSHSTAAV